MNTNITQRNCVIQCHDLVRPDLCGHDVHLKGSNYTQCVECWDIQNISDKVMCDCGGKLEHDKPVFCPQCHSYSVLFTVDN